MNNKLIITVIASSSSFIFRARVLVGSLPVRVMLQQVISHELERIVWACVAHLVQCSHDGGGDGRLQVGLRRQGIHIHSRLAGHGSELRTESLIRVVISTFRVQIGVHWRLLCRVQVVCRALIYMERET